MSTSDSRFTRYLLGELADVEAAALEREYFEHPDVFARVTEVETALVDDYVRNRLAPAVRQRFEAHYLADPRRRWRVEFAQTLQAKIDGTTSDVEPRPARSWSFWPRLSLAAALAVLIVATGVLWMQSRRLRDELARSKTALALQEQRARDLQGQLSTAQERSRELTTELERSRRPSLVSLLLTVPSARAPQAGPAPTLTIPAGASEVQLQLTMEDVEYPSYRVTLNPVAGAPVFTRSGLVPQRNGSTARLDVTVSPDRLGAGDYLLTLSGERPGRRPEAASQLLFRVVTGPRSR